MPPFRKKNTPKKAASHGSKRPPERRRANAVSHNDSPKGGRTLPGAAGGVATQAQLSKFPTASGDFSGAQVVRPEILAPAGDMQAALAAFSAGADAVYLGLKHFSARMQAENFSTTELAKLCALARQEDRRVYVAMNTLVKPGELGQAYRLVRRLALAVNPHALIVQDPAFFDVARQAGFAGELHLSTLANVTHQAALESALSLGASRVIVPRELSFEEVAALDAACPDALALEIFVHGALCFCVSGRCWWSSYMGGKSGLRGRCVQPCRRMYKQKGREGRFFSCMDLALNGGANALASLAHVRSWKIEGRKKGPHYVYYATRAYATLRDGLEDPEARKQAQALLAHAFGRPSTPARFFGADETPTAAKPEGGAGKGGAGKGGAGKGEGQTSSGLLLGRVGKEIDGRFTISPRVDILANDLLRIGYEDEPWHCTALVKGAPGTRGARAAVRRAGEDFVLPLPRGKRPKAGTPVFLIDRKEPELLARIDEWKARLNSARAAAQGPAFVGSETPVMPTVHKEAGRRKILDVRLLSSLPHGREGKEGIRPGTVQGLWLSPKAVREVSRTLYGRISWWLPPVIWPNEETQWKRLVIEALRSGARHFVCNAPWQSAFFASAKGVSLVAGPFCNLANAASLGIMERLGFSAAIISPELGAEDILALPGQSPLPLGIVLSGYWPVGISRFRPGPVKAQDGFQSPKGEEFWMRRYGANLWLYPGWPLDLSAHRRELEGAGYTTFVEIDEKPPKSIPEAKRPGEFNWRVDVL